LRGQKKPNIKHRKKRPPQNKAKIAPSPNMMNIHSLMMGNAIPNACLYLLQRLMCSATAAATTTTTKKLGLH
jgi:hypothetical protein